MKLLGLVFLLFTSVLASVEKAPEETVVVLSTKNFGDTLKDHQYVLVYFHSDSAKSEDFLFDNTLDDDFDVAAEEAKEILPGIKFGKLNTTDQKGYTAMFNITELPAILLFTKGKTTPIEYDGDKTTSDILDWLTQKVDNNIPKLKTVEELKALIKNHTHLSLYLGSPLSNGYANFVAASTSFLNNIGFAISDEAAIKEEVDADEETLVVYRNHSEEISHIHGPFTIQRIKSFIDSHMYPAILGFNAISKKRIFDENRDAIFFLGNEADISGPALEPFRLISEQFRDKLVFTASTIKDSYGSALAEYLGVSEADLPVITILHSTGKMLKYRLDQDLTFRNLGMFLLNFYYNNLIPYYKSSLPPFEEYDGDIKIVVSKTFKEIVLDEDKDVLIEFYSPKCKRCQAFAPIYDSIATNLTDIPNLIVAKIDGATNDVEGVELSGFPSIRYYPRGKKQSPLTYSGDLTEEAVVDFIRNQNSGEVKN